MDRTAQTALGSARDRFLEGLERRADELRAAVRRMADAPDDEQVREEMRRRLHALHATAQVFEEERLSVAVKEVIGVLDGASALGNDGLDAALRALAHFADALGSYVGPEVQRAGDGSHPPAAAAEGSFRAEVAQRSAEASLLRQSAIRPSVESGIALTQSVAGFLPAPAVNAVLVVDSAAAQARVRDVLPLEEFEVLGAADAEQAIQILHADSPDFALVSGELASLSNLHLVRRLQTDPLSEVRAVYVLLPQGASYDAEFLRQTGADGVLVEPLDGPRLAALIAARTEVARRAVGTLSTLAEGTAEDVAVRFAEEIRRGVVDSLQSGRHETVRFDDPSELMAVAWSAIGRVRSHLAEQSRGRIRFRHDALRDAPTVLALGEDRAAADADESLASALVGRRILVADDDPAVLWSFSGLLREAGAQVLEALDGAQALELARRKRPHVVVSDILMPKIDGFALCREIKRDALLAHVPVILLSWKEDFLQRMRELDSGASGYLRKEAGTRQIVAGLAEVLRPRTRLEEHLRAGGEVRGRIEGLGIWPLLETVAAVRPSARVSVRDAWNLFELDLRGGEELGITRTAADGSFARGTKALLQLVGVNSGRFAVKDAAAPLRNALADPLGKALLDAGKQMGALLDAVSGTRLMHVASLAFDDEVLASLLHATPTPLADVAARFRTGSASANAMLMDGAFTPADLEENLRELARRGAIVGVWSETGEDVVALCQREREARPGTLLHAASPSRKSAAPPAAVQGREGVASFQTTAAASTHAGLLFPDAQAESEVVTTTDPARVGASEFAADTGAPRADEGLLMVPPLTDGLAGNESAVAARDVQDSADLAVAVVGEPAEPRQRDLGTSPPAAPTRREGSRLAITLAALVVVGFFGWRAVLQLGVFGAGARPHRAQASAARPAPRSDAAPAAAAKLSPAPVVDAPAAAAPTPASQQDTTTHEAASLPAQAGEGPVFGRVLPYVDPGHGVAVKTGEGLLVVEYQGAGQAPRLKVADRDLGTPPLAAALAAGRHELVIRQGGRTSFRYVLVRSGETRVVTLSAADL